MGVIWSYLEIPDTKEIQQKDAVLPYIKGLIRVCDTTRDVPLRAWFCGLPRSRSKKPSQPNERTEHKKNHTRVSDFVVLNQTDH